VAHVNTRGADEHHALAVLLQIAVPFRLELTARFRGLTERDGCLIPGPAGWGEFAPFPDYQAPAAAHWLESALEAAFGVWPNAQRQTIPVNAIIPAVEPDRAAAMTSTAYREYGCTTVKVKVQGDLAADEARVSAIRETLDSLTADGRMRLDANGVWSTKQALHDGTRLAAYGLEYIEQPTRDLQGLDVLRAIVPIAVDEGIRRDGRRTVSDVADIAILKVAPMGGVAATLAAAAEIDVPVIVSGSLDSSVGLAAGIQAAAALPDLAGACGFATGALLGSDVVDVPTLPVDGGIAVGRRSPDLDALARARACADMSILERLREAWWAGVAPRWTGAILESQDRAR
jgi:O-succinylbenzoate synthase